MEKQQELITLENESELESILNRLKLPYRVIDGNNCKDEKSLMQEFTKVLEFPEEDMDNWDALYDWIRDLTWIENIEDGIIIVIKNYNHLLPNDDKNKQICEEVLEDTVDHWANAPMEIRIMEKIVPFYIIIIP